MELSEPIIKLQVRILSVDKYEQCEIEQSEFITLEQLIRMCGDNNSTLEARLNAIVGRLIESL